MKKKKKLAIVILAIVAAIGLFVWVRKRGLNQVPDVTLTFVQYKWIPEHRWWAAELQLSNNSDSKVKYFGVFTFPHHVISGASNIGYDSNFQELASRTSVKTSVNLLPGDKPELLGIDLLPINSGDIRLRSFLSSVQQKFGTTNLYPLKTIWCTNRLVAPATNPPASDQEK